MFDGAHFHYGTMFSILLNKNVPYCIKRSLMVSYLRQEAIVIYEILVNPHNFSPTLFNLYMDRLYATLKNSELGAILMVNILGHCHYVDDITLSCPSVQGLNKLMNIYSDFTTNTFITFNAKKTICFKYGESVKLTEHVILDGNVISLHTGVRHLGNFIK